MGVLLRGLHHIWGMQVLLGSLKASGGLWLHLGELCSWEQPQQRPQALPHSRGTSAPSDFPSAMFCFFPSDSRAKHQWSFKLHKKEVFWQFSHCYSSGAHITLVFKPLGFKRKKGRQKSATSLFPLPPQSTCKLENRAFAGGLVGTDFPSPVSSIWYTPT